MSGRVSMEGPPPDVWLERAKELVRRPAEDIRVDFIVEAKIVLGAIVEDYEKMSLCLRSNAHLLALHDILEALRPLIPPTSLWNVVTIIAEIRNIRDQMVDLRNSVARYEEGPHE